ncbi:MAG: M20 family metallopeptidase [Firmicutes bacterium]|nr:M20 family metallopeptidase [Bacillota bacterium]
MVDRHLGEAAVGILKDLVAIPTYDGIEEAARYLEKRLQAVGVQCQVGQKEGKPLYLLAELGQGEPSLIFNGHIDTVPPGREDEWQHPPFAGVCQDGLLWGRGSADAKGPLAAQVAAFESLVGKLPKGRLVLMAVGEEERGGLGTKGALAAGVRGQGAVVGEPTALEVHVAHKGVLRVAITVRGKAAHASNPQSGSNAIMGMSRVLPRLQALHQEITTRWEDFTGSPSLVVTTIEGGRALNMVPDLCRIAIDRRLIPGETGGEAWRELEKVVEEERARGLRISMEEIRTIQSAYTDPHSPIAKVLQETITKTLKRPAKVAGFNACSDMSYLNQAGIPTVIFGPGNIQQAHRLDEFVDLEAVRASARVYREMALNWLGS